MSFKDMPLDTTLQKGDIVTITGPGEHDMLVREVVAISELSGPKVGGLSSLYANLSLILEHGTRTLTRIQRPVPALPTVEGDYILTSSGVRRIRSLIGGNWVGVAGWRISETALREYVEAGATLTRVIPADEVKRPEVDMDAAATALQKEWMTSRRDSYELDFKSVLRRVLEGEFDL